MPRPLSPDQIEALRWLKQRTAVDGGRASMAAMPEGKTRYTKLTSFHGLRLALCRPQLFAGLERRGYATSVENGERPLHEKPRKWREYAITQAGVDALAAITEG